MTLGLFGALPRTPPRGRAQPFLLDLLPSLLYFGFAALLLSGCAAVPAELPPLPEPPAQWQAPGDKAAVSPLPWFQDQATPALTALVKEALANNHNLKRAAFRMKASQERARLAGAVLFPKVEAGLDGKRGQSVAGNDRIITSNSFALDVTLSWEADLWGRLAASVQGSGADALAAQADFYGARLSLSGEVARAWLAAMEAGMQITLAERTLSSYRASLATIEERYRQGLSNALDLRLARTDVAQAVNQLAQQRRARDGAIRRLEVLLGRYPAGALDHPAPLPEEPAPIPAGLPSELLKRRPDLVAAAHQVDAAHARLKEAALNRLPTLRLTASKGTSSSQLSDLLDWDRLVWNLIGGLTQPIFQGGRLEAEETLARMTHGEAWAAYATAILQAFMEVEAALAAEVYYQEQLKALAQAAREAALGAELALSQYRNGLVEIVTLLEAQRRAHATESTRLRTLRERLDNRIALHLALGGGFVPAPAPPADKDVQP